MRIEISDPKYHSSNGNFEITLDLIDEIKQEVHSKKIVITKKVWHFTFPKKLNLKYEEKSKLIDDFIKKWLKEYADSQEKKYWSNWDKQPDTQKISSYEITQRGNIGIKWG